MNPLPRSDHFTSAELSGDLPSKDLLKHVRDVCGNYRQDLDNELTELCKFQRDEIQTRLNNIEKNAADLCRITRKSNYEGNSDSLAGLESSLKDTESRFRNTLSKLVQMEQSSSLPAKDKLFESSSAHKEYYPTLHTFSRSIVDYADEEYEIIDKRDDFDTKIRLQLLTEELKRQKNRQSDEKTDIFTLKNPTSLIIPKYHSFTKGETLESSSGIIINPIECENEEKTIQSLKRLSLDETAT